MGLGSQGDAAVARIQQLGEKETTEHPGKQQQKPSSALPKEGEDNPAGLGAKKRFITVSATQHFTPPFSQSQHCYYSNPPVCLRLPFVLLPPQLLPGPGTPK